VDLGGRLVVPGITDGHIHATRGGAAWTRELHWEDVRSPAEALEQLRTAAVGTPAGSWITVVGGWHGSQFPGHWLPTRAELTAAAPQHLVYVQSLYEVGIANDAAMERVEDELARVDGMERDASGRPTGRVVGMPAFTVFSIASGGADLEEEIRGTRTMFATFAGLGMTGVIDPGGFGMRDERYAAIRAVHQRGQLDVRTRLFYSAVTRGCEIDEMQEIIREFEFDNGDAYLRSVGLGEIVHFGCHDFEGLHDFDIADSSREEFERISFAAAHAGLPIHVHAVTDDVADLILTAWENVNAQHSIRPLRFSLAHGDLLGSTNIRRMAALGVGLIVDDRQAFRAGASGEAWGGNAMLSVPPLGDLREAGIQLGLGTDATRASSYNPWIALWWMVGGQPLDRSSQRSACHLLDRASALRMATTGNAWFTHEESARGVLGDGYLADLAVLDRNYFEVGTDEIPEIRSDLTMVGGRITHSSGAIAEPTATSF
jgi:predicted amidohydrolase YtcJ